MKKNVICLTVLLLSLALRLRAETYEQQMTAIAQNLSNAAEAAGKKKIAVISFIDLQGRERELGAFLAEELSVDLINMGISKKSFSVVDRQHLQTILEEQQFSASGLMDPATVKKLGQISGADAMIIGNITELQDEYSISIKLIASESAENLGADRKKFSKTKETNDLWSRTLGHAMVKKSVVATAVNQPIDPNSTGSESGGNEGLHGSQGDLQSPAEVGSNKTGKTPPPALTGFINRTEHETVELKYVKELNDGSIKVTIAFKNTNKDQLDMSVGLESPSQNAYVVDNLGNEYKLINSTVLTENGVTIVRPGCIKINDFTFEPISKESSTISVYFSYIRTRSGKASSTERVIFNSVPLMR